MALTVSDSGGGDFAPCPEGTHIARCVRVIDLGMQPGSVQFPEPRHRVQFVWEVPGELVVIDSEERPTLLMARYSASLHKKSQLRAMLESWRGRAFTDPELKGFALKNVLDATCMVSVVHTPDGKYANVRTVSKMPRGIVAPGRMLDLVYYEIEDGHNAVYAQLSEKMRATIDIGAGLVAAPVQVAPAAPAYDTQRRGGELRQAVASMPPVAAMPDYLDADIPF